MENDEGIEKLRTMIDESERVVIFTGAGISTESGIPDFRSPGGVWDKHKPIEFSDFLASDESKRATWRRKFATEKLIDEAKPNLGHLAIAELVKRGKVTSVITQNIDGLHQKSGIPEEKIIELHGNSTYAICLDCRKRYELEEIRQIFEKDETLPYCTECKGVIKTATISFGQPMPIEEMKAAQIETLSCDLFIAIGSSLVVYPAAGFPELAKQNRSLLVIINRDPTNLGPIADLVLHTEIGPTLSAAVGLN